MDLRQIEYILAIAEEKNITKAAEKLYITQSALNQFLLKLEHELHTPLFHRLHGELAPTEAGIIYIQYGEKIMALKKEAYSRINDLTKCVSGQIRIGLTVERSGDLIIKVLPQFKQKYPTVVIDPVESNVISLVPLITHQSLDIAILTIAERLWKGLEYEHIINEELILAAPLHHPLTQQYKEKPVIHLEDFQDIPFVLMNKSSTQRPLIDKIFAAHKIIPHIFIETATNATRLNLVRNGFAFSIIPEAHAIKDDKIKYFYIADHPTLEIVLAYKKGFYLNKACKYMIHLIKEYWNTYPYYKVQ